MCSGRHNNNRRSRDQEVEGKGVGGLEVAFNSGNWVIDPFLRGRGGKGIEGH